MPTTPEGFTRRLDKLKAEINAQGLRVRGLVEAAITTAFDRDPDAAQRIIDLDDEIDRFDVEIEVAAVRILSDATRVNATLSERQVRTLLTIVKVNNELERIADIGVAMAEHVQKHNFSDGKMPDTLRVMAYSVVGIQRDVNAALHGADPDLARLALRADDAVMSFRDAIIADARGKVLAGDMSIDFAFFISGIADRLTHIADHCSNMAEQTIYLTTGKIVRHDADGWHDRPSPGGHASASSEPDPEEE